MEVKIRPVSPRTSPSFCTLRRQRREAGGGWIEDTHCPAALTAPDPFLAPVPSMWTSDRLGCRRICFTRANYSEFQRFYFITLHRYFPKHNILHFPRRTLFNCLLAMSLRYKKRHLDLHISNLGVGCYSQRSYQKRLRYIHSTEYYTAGKGKRQTEKHEGLSMRRRGRTASVLKGKSDV